MVASNHAKQTAHHIAKVVKGYSEKETIANVHHVREVLSPHPAEHTVKHIGKVVRG